MLAGGGVAGKGNPGAGIVTVIAEYHRLHTNRGAEAVGNVAHFTVNDGAWGMPGHEYRFHRALQLFEGILREVNEGFVNGDDCLPVLGGHFGVVFFVVLCLVLADFAFKFLAVNMHDHIGKHLDKTPVRVVGETGISGFFGKAFGDLIVEAQIEDGVHHSRH